MKSSLLILVLFTMTFAETFGESMVTWGQILFILGLFTLPPLVITAIIVLIVKVFKHGAKLTSDLFKD